MYRLLECIELKRLLASYFPARVSHPYDKTTHIYIYITFIMVIINHQHTHTHSIYPHFFSEKQDPNTYIVSFVPR